MPYKKILKLCRGCKKEKLIRTNNDYCSRNCYLNENKIPWNKGLKNPYSEEQLKNLSNTHIGISNSSKGKTR
jgi:hypothetical protein